LVKNLVSLDKSSVKPTARRWHRVHAEGFLEWVQPRRLAELEPGVDEYLRRLDREGYLPAWQFEQVIEVIQKLLTMAVVRWLAQIDWVAWHASAQELGLRYPTVARDYDSAPKGLRGNAASRSPPAAEESASGPTLDAGVTSESVRRDQAPLFERLIAEIRTRGYSIRTERSYGDWVVRFLVFSGGQPADEMGDDEIKGSGVSDDAKRCLAGQGSTPGVFPRLMTWPMPRHTRGRATCPGRSVQ